MIDVNAILFDAKPAKRVAYDPMDAAIRTVMTEEADPKARQWVAGVIMNRAKAKGGDMLGALSEKNAFEPYDSPEWRAIDPNSREYKATAALVGPILRGEEPDPSGGMTHFYAPKSQAAKAKTDGRPVKAKFDDGTGVQVGETLFFKNPQERDASVDDVLFGKFDVGAERAKLIAKEGPKPVPITRLNPEQRKAYETQVKAGGYDPREPEGSLKNPRWAVNNETIEQQLAVAQPGEYFRDLKGDLHYIPSGKDPDSFLRGLATGAENVGGSIMGLYPGAENSQLVNAIKFQNERYAAEPQGIKSVAGNIAGELIPTTLALGISEGALAPTLGKTGIGRFLLGTAGAGGGLKSLPLRGASLATRGGLEGGFAAGATSLASDQPTIQQIGEGVLGGSIAGPLLPAAVGAGRKVANTVTSIAEPLTTGGRDKMVTRLLDKVAGGPTTLDLTEYVPGSMPTMGEASGNAGLASLERVARTNPNLVTRFGEQAGENVKARANYFAGIAKTPDDVTDAIALRESRTAPLRDAALTNAKPADPTAVATHIDDVLKGEAGKRAAVTTVLNRVKANLYDDAGNLETDARRLYGVRKDIGDMLDNVGDKDHGSAKAARAELMAARAEVDKAIEAAAPGFGRYLQTFARMSRPIDEMNYLQSLNLTDAQGNFTLSKVQGALTKIAKERRKPGTNEAKSLSKESMGALQNLRADLKRAGQIDMGKARGSDTHQRAAMDNFGAEQGVPLSALGVVLGPKASILAQGARFMGQSGRDEATQLLATRLLGPQYAPPPGQPPGARNAALELIGRMSGAALPVSAGMLSNALINGQ